MFSFFFTGGFTMQAASPQMIIIGSLIAVLVVGLVARYFGQRSHTHGSHNRFGVDHSQDIFEMGNRTRAAALRKENERGSASATSLSR
ncbi:MAG: hypothetical protein ABIZ09_18950 [Rhodoferax sp.]